MPEFWFIHNLRHKNDTTILRQKNCTEITALQFLEDLTVANVKGATCHSSAQIRITNIHLHSSASYKMYTKMTSTSNVSCVINYGGWNYSAFSDIIQTKFIPQDWKRSQI